MRYKNAAFSNRLPLDRHVEVDMQATLVVSCLFFDL